MFKLLVDKQITDKDIDDVKYWLERLCDYEYAAATRTEVFQPALRGWGYGN